MSHAEGPAPGWFEIAGEQQGRRSLDEQMAGLHPALNDAAGKRVCDFGCAEGLISLEFAKVAARVLACDYNAAMVETAARLGSGVTNVEFRCVDLREVMSDRVTWACDVLLALAILHKMPDPQAALEFFADVTRELLVIRLPRGSNGDNVKAKHSGKSCSVNFTMKQRGFALEKTLTGPRQERVQYWRK